MAVSTIDPNGLNVGQFGNRNVVINGGFDVWQRGISQTSSAYGSDDRWANYNFGSTKVASQQGFTLGQTDVVGNPKYYSRTVVTSVAGAGNYVLKRQSVEGVTTFSGETVTFTFWAKADANKNIAVEFYQNFGSGGSPSGLVFLPSQTVSLTTSWAKHSLTFDIPSVSGKTLGTDGTDSLSFHFWFDAGSDYNSRTNSLGQQSGTFDISQVQLEVGDTATPFEHRSYSDQLQSCMRYFYKYPDSGDYAHPLNLSSGFRSQFVTFPAIMRVAPTLSNVTGSGSYSPANPDSTSGRVHGAYFQWNNVTSSNFARVDSGFTADAEL
jgi:hypothetical protein